MMRAGAFALIGLILTSSVAAAQTNTMCLDEATLAKVSQLYIQHCNQNRDDLNKQFQDHGTVDPQSNAPAHALNNECKPADTFIAQALNNPDYVAKMEAHIELSGRDQSVAQEKSYFAQFAAQRGLPVAEDKLKSGATLTHDDILTLMIFVTIRATDQAMTEGIASCAP